MVTDGLLAAAADLVVGTVQAERATWTRWNLLAEIERVTRGWRFPSPADRDQVVEALLGLVTDPDRVIRIQAPALIEEPEALRRVDGDPVFSPHAAERYTSPATLEALGIRRMNQMVEHDDTPQIRGMIFKVRHLVQTEEA